MNEEVTIETQEHFIKQSLRSRTQISGANGPLHLMVPRTKGPERTRMTDVKVHEDGLWRKLHWRSLESAYRRSPYFEYYEHRLEPFFQTEFASLLALNLNSTKLAVDLLGMAFEPEFTSEYQKEPDGIDLRNAWNKVNYREHSPVIEFPRYIQVFSDRYAFQPDLSILDLLFCEGPHSMDYLRALEVAY
jgi:hypothetical protein